MHHHFLISSFEKNYPRLFLSGTAYHNDNIIIDSAGLEYYSERFGKSVLPEIKEGRFLLAYEDNGEYFIRSDITGQELIFYYNGREGWVVSTSFLHIIEFLKKHSISVSLNKSALSTFRIPHSFGDSLATNDTVVNEIKLLRLDNQIIINKKNKLITQINKIEDDSQNLSPSEIIKIYVKKWQKRIFALSKIASNHKIVCDVSGGVDSRTVFGLILSSDVNLERFDFNSNPTWVDDYKIATILSKAYSIPLNMAKKDKMQRPSVYAQFELFCYSSIGVYRNVYFPANDTASTNFHFSGSGGENIRQFYNATPNEFINRFEKFFLHENFKFDDFRTLFLSNLDELGIDKDDPKGMIKHYRNFRSRFHFGREWYKRYSTILITPLFDDSLNKLCDSLPVSDIDKNYIILSIMLESSFHLPLFPFDKPYKNFDIELYNTLAFNYENDTEKDDCEIAPLIFWDNTNTTPQTLVETNNMESDIDISCIISDKLLNISKENIKAYSSDEELNNALKILHTEKTRAGYTKTTYLLLLYFLQENNVI
ncbi:hypothetical protein [Aeromonas media]|uniref:hypothetical protein n=1 Tax=Aeromonas media TaxID=651 RepID=UPI00295313FA|nr:hypothetical protein [Aeromonas media]WOQ11918.1 hypothetical protein R2X36_13520 [Aeromonas media]